MNNCLCCHSYKSLGKREITNITQEYFVTRACLTGSNCVYLDLCTYSSFNLKQTLRIEIESTNGLKHKFAWSNLYCFLYSRAINIDYEIQT